MVSPGPILTRPDRRHVQVIVLGTVVLTTVEMISARDVSWSKILYTPRAYSVQYGKDNGCVSIE